MKTKAVFFGCESTTLGDAERAFFEAQQPLGFILFARNCESPVQVAELVRALKSTVSHKDVPVLIDQEGGRVARLKPPHWRAYPPAQVFVDMAKTRAEAAQRACYLNARLIAEELAGLGINTNCAPVADLRLTGAHDIIGDRAFGASADEIVPLARAQAQGLMDGGVMPVLKHIPGHGRALVDSHESLPIVEESLDTLSQTDFKPFVALADLPMGMTAHICYQCVDKDVPATLSPKTISLIRSTIGFDGVLMSDDVSMKALSGDLGQISRKALAAGCDVVLHCNGKMEEMQAVATGVGELSDAAKRRVSRAFERIAKPQPADASVLLAEMDALMPRKGAA